MAGSLHFSDVRIAFRNRPTSFGMLGYGIMYDSILHYQSNILSDTRLWLWKGHQENVESPLGICHSFSCRNMDFFLTSMSYGL